MSKRVVDFVNVIKEVIDANKRLHSVLASGDSVSIHRESCVAESVLYNCIMARILFTEGAGDSAIDDAAIGRCDESCMSLRWALDTARGMLSSLIVSQEHLDS